MFLLIDDSGFWHQMNARKFSSISDFIVFDILRNLPKGGTIRYLRLLTTFSVSGVMHLVIDIAAGLSLTQSGAMHFFWTHALGIVFEDFIVSIYRSLSGSNAKARAAYRGEKLIGYLWVALFMTWSTPMYMFPILQRSTADFNDSPIPFSVVGKVRNSKW